MSQRFAFLLILITVCAAAQKKPVTLDSISQRNRADFGGTPIWAPDGKRFAHFSGSKVMLYDVEAKQDKELLALQSLEEAAVQVPEPEHFDWTNRRVHASSLQWSASGQQILL